MQTTATTQDVHFTSQGDTLAGRLYLPADMNQQRLPAVVIAGAWTTVKEQMAATYAEALAARNVIALTFDFLGWGASPGAIPFLEDPARKTQDLLAAAALLATLPEVDPTAVAGLGICAGAGAVIDAVAASPHLHAAAVVAPWLHDRAIVEETYGGPEGVAQLIDQARAARKTFETQGVWPIIPAAGAEPEALMGNAPYYTEPNRGQIPEYDNRFNVASWEPWLTYDALQSADHLEKPVLLVHSEAAAIPAGARRFAERMGDGATLVMLDNVTQFDFYDEPRIVNHAADLLAAFYVNPSASQGGRS